MGRLESHTFLLQTKAKTAHFAATLAKELKSGDLVLLSGDLGAGKTTLVQNILLEIGLKETVLSPTYSLMNLYELPSGLQFSHLDFYRLESLSELETLGAEEVLFSNRVSFVEWWEKFPKYFEGIEKSALIRIELKRKALEERSLSLEMESTRLQKFQSRYQKEGLGFATE